MFWTPHTGGLDDGSPQTGEGATIW